MFNLLHTFSPNPILVSFGPLHIYWYGMFIVLGILAAIFIAMKLANFYDISKETIIDLVFYIIIGGVIGARIYHVLIEYQYYLSHPLDVFKIWNGGLAIHGGLIVGVTIAFFYTRRKKIDFWKIAAISAPALALAQAIGRWGNYFNQEIYGQPTGLPWGIPIDAANRLPDYYIFKYYHPTFLYESLGSLAIFSVLIFMHYLVIKKKKLDFQYIFFGYLILYSLLRFSVETLRIDYTLVFLGLRLPQIVSLIIMFFSFSWLLRKSYQAGT